MNRNSRTIVLGLAVAALLVLSGTSCFDEDSARSHIVITRVADPAWPDTLGGAPFQSDVLDAGSDGIPGTLDDVVYEDEAYVSVENYAPSPLLIVEPGEAFGNVILERYEVHFDIADEELQPVKGRMHLVIPSGEQNTASIVLVPGLAKTQPPLSALAGSMDELMGSAHITVYGYEETSQHEVSAEATLEIHFADWVN